MSSEKKMTSKVSTDATSMVKLMELITTKFAEMDAKLEKLTTEQRAQFGELRATMELTVLPNVASTQKVKVTKATKPRAERKKKEPVVAGSDSAVVAPVKRWSNTMYYVAGLYTTDKDVMTLFTDEDLETATKVAVAKPKHASKTDENKHKAVGVELWGIMAESSRTKSRAMYSAWCLENPVVPLVSTDVESEEKSEEAPSE